MHDFENTVENAYHSGQKIKESPDQKTREVK